MSEETSQVASESTEQTATSEATTVNTEGETQSTTTYMDGKYDSVSALESGYKELQSSYSSKTAEYSKAMQGRTGAPEAYEFGEGVVVSEGMQDYAREQGYSNEAFNELAGAYQADQQKNIQAHVTAQKELLGKDADTRLSNIKDWASANGADEATFQSMMSSAKAVEFIEGVMKQGGGTQQAAVQAAPAVDRDTLKQKRFAKDEFGVRRMSSDPRYRAQVEAQEAEFISQGGRL